MITNAIQPAKIGKLKSAILARLLPEADPGNLLAVKSGAFVQLPEYLIATAHKQPDVRLEEPFGSIARRVIESRTSFLNYDRLYTIFNAIKSVRCNNPKPDFHAVEIGVYRGGGSLFMAEVLTFLGVTEPKLDSFDTFAGHQKEDRLESKDRLDVHTDRVFLNTSLSQVQSLLSEFSFAKCIAGRFEDTCSVLSSAKLDFVHLDVDLYAPSIHALNFVFPRLRRGGSIVVDDYRYWTCPGAKDAVDEFLTKFGRDCFGFPLFTGQFVVVKV
jgi:O-methyltransferase